MDQISHEILWPWRIRKCNQGRTETRGYVTHQRIQKRIMKRRRDREIRLESRPAPSYLEPTGWHHTSEAISGQRRINRKSLDQHSGQRRREWTDVLKNDELEKQYTSREKACGKRSIATDKKLAEAKKKLEGEIGWTLGQKLVLNDEGSWAKRVTAERWHGEVENSARTESWDSWHEDRRDDREANSGYHG